jgi:hypothetical protein
MLVRLMYASRAAQPLGAEELSALVRHCQTSNPKLGITGVLCSSEGLYIQVLEGGRAAVNKLYNQIAADPRHRDVTLLTYEEIAERRFASWAMGQVSVARLNPGLLLKYSECAVLDPYAVSGAAMAKLFEELVATASVQCPG